MNHTTSYAGIFGLVWLLMPDMPAAEIGRSGLPENLAPRARITANSEYSRDYEARFVADGKIPSAGHQADLRQAWAVNGKTHGQQAELVFEWDQPVTVAEMIYYGRTGWFLEECWRSYKLYAGDPSQPLLEGEFKKQHGPQRIKLASPIITRKIGFRFTSSYGGPNPGASEIQIFARALSDKEFARLAEACNSYIAQVKEPEPRALREFMLELVKMHGTNYARAGEHQKRLAQLEAQSRTGQEVSGELVGLQREVLLFDIDRLLVIKRHEINASHVYTYHNEGFRAGGGIYLQAVHDASAPEIELVASPTGQILDCDLDYTGTVVLFSWRKTESEGYHLWRINVDGTGLKQLTAGEWHDYNGCWLPDGGIAFVSTRAPQFAYCWNSPVGVVHRMEADGANQRRLSANYLNDFTPYPLEDGRIIYTRWEYVDKPAIPIQSLWTLNPDGTGLAGYFGNRVISPGTFMEARSIPGTTKILCTMTGHNGPARGAIGIIDRTRGVNAQEAIWNVTPDVPVPGVEQGNGNFEGSKLYSSPHPLDASRFLVSARGPILVRNYAGSCQSMVLNSPANGLQYFAAQPVRARPRPPVLASKLTDDPAPPAAWIYLQDVYDGLEPHVKRGEIKRLRVVREMPKGVRINPDKRAFGFQFPVISAGATYAAKLVLGEVEIDQDGSAYFEVPSGVPIYFMALDAQGRAVQRMRSFTHFMPGERQGCIGCHELRGHAARRQHPPEALNRPLQKLTPPEWGTGGFDYARIVQPVLDRYCLECHSGENPPAQVDLCGDPTDFFNVSYEILARGRRQSGEAQWYSPYVSWIPSYNGFETNILQVSPRAWGSPQSRLAEIILSNHPDAAGKPLINIDDQGRRRILAWIDLNVPYYGSSETTHPDNPGSRRIYPAELDQTLAAVASRRCIPCHQEGKIPRQFWTRIVNPHLNSFLLAPLAKSAGGTERCGKTVFANRQDPDYRAILQTFEPVLAELKQKPRLDMAGAQANLNVNRSCK